MKKKSQSGFTIVELLAVVVILGVISTIAVVSYTGYIDRSRNQSYAIAENAMKTAVIDFYADCEDSFNRPDLCERPLMPETKGESVQIYLKDLLEYDYLKKISDPAVRDSFCSAEQSYVKVTNDTEEGSFNTSYTYQVCLSCSKYKSAGCE